MAKFEHMYMRPHVDSDGTIPDDHEVYLSPDIWINGNTPMTDWKTFLASEKNYKKSSSNMVEFGRDNFLYVRCKNDGASEKENFVSLYYAPNSLILNPQQWKNNRIKSDGGDTQVSMGTPDKNKIGVNQKPFVWENVPVPPAGADHYCIMAHMNDADNTNPFPAPDTYVDMGNLLHNNLRWAQRNTTIVLGSPSQFEYSANLDVDMNTMGNEAEFDLLLRPDKSFVGWEVEFVCSRPDKHGNPVELKRTKITGGTQLLGGTFSFDYGFNGLLYVRAYNTSGNPAVPGQKLPFEVTYRLHKNEIELARRYHIIDEAFCALVDREIHGRTKNISYCTVVGGYTGMLV